MALTINTFLSGCGADCDDVVLLPAIPEEQDCTVYGQLKGEISDLYIIPTGAPAIMASWSTTPTAVANAVDNTVTDNSKSKWLVGIGDRPAPEKTRVQYPKEKSKITERLYTLNFVVKQLDAATYDFLRQLQCGSTGFTFYYADLNDYIYGDSDGITPDSVDVDFVHASGTGNYITATIILTWKADGDPQRRVNPLS